MQLLSQIDPCECRFIFSFTKTNTSPLSRRWLIATLVLFAIIAPVYLIWIEPAVATSRRAETALVLPKGPVALLLLTPTISALGVIVASATLVTTDLRSLLLPTRARVFGAISLFLFFPGGMVGRAPANLMFGPLLSRKFSPDAVEALPLILAPICYLTACILSSVFARRDGKIRAYALILIGAFTATIVLGYAQKFWI